VQSLGEKFLPDAALGSHDHPDEEFFMAHFDALDPGPMPRTGHRVTPTGQMAGALLIAPLRQEPAIFSPMA